VRVIRRTSFNTCQHTDCSNEVDEPGLLCRLHWRAVPGVLKDQYLYTRKMILQAVKAHEDIR
jgi:hypothetical protein